MNNSNSKRYADYANTSTLIETSNEDSKYKLYDSRPTPAAKLNPVKQVPSFDSPNRRLKYFSPRGRGKGRYQDNRKSPFRRYPSEDQLSTKNVQNTSAPNSRIQQSKTPTHQQPRIPSKQLPNKEPRKYPIGYKALEEIIENTEMENSDIALQLTTKASGFELRLNDMRDGFIQLILKLFKRLCNDGESNFHLSRLLVTLLENNFHVKILEFITKIMVERSGKKAQNSEDVANALILMRAWILYASNTAKLGIGMLLPVLQSAINNLEEYENIKVLLAEVEELYNNNIKKPIQKKNRDPDYLAEMHNEQPIDDFRQISVFPTEKDIHEKDPFVRTNLTNSAYHGIDHYLDVQFRLLREDFVRPLREGIHQYRRALSASVKARKRLDGVKIYEDVSIEFPKLQQKGISYCLHFDVNRLKFVQWQNSKRLIFGNLICLSADDFQENFLFASIVNRDLEELKKGFIDVEFWNCNEPAIDALQDEEDIEGESEDEYLDDQELRIDKDTLKQHRVLTCASMVSTDDMKKTYAMAESEAYFEAYRHVLAGLQATTVIPMQRYIVDCQTEVRSPRYLRVLGGNAKFDFSCILDKSGSSVGKYLYNVLDTARWPSADYLGLDPSQVDALKSALTQELSVIQGPPGTGKTFVGLMIMKILLANRKSKKLKDLSLFVKNVPSGPILVVCYTNHALDQFLEGISKFHPEGLVRVGGRSKNKSLDRYMLHNLRRNVTVNKHLGRDFYNLRNNMEKVVNEVQEIQDTLKASTESILSLNVLKSVIPTRQLDQLMTLHKSRFLQSKRSSRDKDDCLLEWLEVSKKVFSIPETSFIINEPIETLVEFYQRFRLSRNRVLHAIDCTGQIFHEGLMECFQNHTHHDIADEPSIHPDLVCGNLMEMQLDAEFERMIYAGWPELDVKCAVFVLKFLSFEGIVSPQMVGNWLHHKKRMEQENDLDWEEVNADIEEEAALVEDERMIEEDFFMQVEKKRNQQNERRITTTKISAVKHNNIYFKPDSEKLPDGFQFQHHEKKKRKQELKKRMMKELVKTDCMKESEAEQVYDIFALTTKEKWKLYRFWVRSLLNMRRNHLNQKALEYKKLTNELNDLRNREDFEVLKNADVIAMTTTGAAKYRDMIFYLPVSIIIVEEAAEVLEAHIVTSMPEKTQHLILIGDHQQLKPSPTVYELALKFNLDISLFERMINNGLPYSRLELQHRMRPRIADLIRPHIYDNLRDHDSVKIFDDVVGVKRNVFFLSHDHLEDNVSDSKSKVNQHEADFMIGLCRHLLLQGYEPEEITILTAYVGQLFAFKKAVGHKLDKKIRITAVDNFQGEENDIILLSLVRSNMEGKIGFLSIENRVCVALSRAKKGLYCIGNFELLKEKSKLWKNILKELERDGLSGTSFPLQCKNDGKIIEVKCLDDFKKAPEGGCGGPCEYRLDCGHVCTRLCHPDDSEHKIFKCQKMVDKTCAYGHVSSIKCHLELRCKHKKHVVLPKCNHFTEIFCYQQPDNVTCNKPCEKTLPCGHRCTNSCGIKCLERCTHKVEILSECGHKMEVKCYEKNLPHNLSHCKEKCNEILKCGHPCKGTCGLCLQGRLHVGCSYKKCGRVLCCGHLCQYNCTSICPPCQKNCETSCVHSRCMKKCSLPCVLCKMECEWKCKHFECTRLCSEPCDRPPCDEACDKKLRCGHPCIGLCGEPCPKLCRICDKDKVEDVFFGDEDEIDARFVQLECGHIFTYENLDKWMEQKNTDESSETDIKLKECPRCKTPIRKVARYGNIINKTLMMINQVREKISGTKQEVDSGREKLRAAFKDDKKAKKHFPKELKFLMEAVRVSASNLDLKVVETQFGIISEFSKIKDLLDNKKKTGDDVVLPNQLQETMKQVVKWLRRKRPCFTEQEEKDLLQEQQRCKDMLKFIQLKGKLSSLSSFPTHNTETGSYNAVQKYVDLIKQRLFRDVFPYTEDKRKCVKTAFEEINKLTPKLLTGLGITDDERKMILKAINLSPGHWFKCKNGHVYCIGECGGATEEGKCPECKEAIGGTSHNLNSTNRLASEMDGATRPVWDPNNFHIPEEVLRWQHGLE